MKSRLIILIQQARRQPTRLPRPWDSPGKNTGVGCHFLLQCMKVKSESEVTQSCPTLHDPMDCSPRGSFVHGIFQKNPVTLLKELSAIKSRYQTLQVRFKPIAVEQKETKSRICATFSKTMTLIQELQKQTDLELLPLTEEEKTAAEQLRAHLSDL
uniref:Uncharacterized protein n=1 Tax=Ovis aries TaxID=9940 RepID=A0AC11BRU6_SHEEP